MSYAGLFSALSSLPEWKELLCAIKDGKTALLHHVASGQRAYLAAALHYQTGRPVVLVMPNELAAGKDAQDISQLLGQQAVMIPPREAQFSRAASSQESTWQRIAMAHSLLSHKARVLCLPIESLMNRMPAPGRFRSATFTLTEGERHEPTALIEALVKNGYERVPMVEGKGQCAMRGAILDVFPPSETNAIRVEFFDDEVDSLREFDPISQRSLRRVKSVEIPPATECLLDPSELDAAAERLLEALEQAPTERLKEASAESLSELPPLDVLFQTLDSLEGDDPDALPELSELALPAANAQPVIKPSEAPTERRMERDEGYRRHMDDVERIRAGFPIRTGQMWLNVLCEDSCSLLDYLDDPIVLCDSPDQLQSAANGKLKAYLSELDEAKKRGDGFDAQSTLLRSYDEVVKELKNLSPVLISDAMQGLGMLEPEKLIELDSEPVAPYQSQMHALCQDLTMWREKGYAIALLSGGEARGKRLQRTLDDESVPSVYCDQLEGNLTLGEIAILPLSIAKGFIHEKAKLILVSDTDIYGTSYQRARKKQKVGERIASFTELHLGDFVVHDIHGVGIFQGIVQMTSENIKRDYLLIQYAGADKLYVPTDQFDRVQRFIGAEQQQPKLNHLGGNEWQRQKGKVKAGLKTLAFNLVELYAKRRAQTGYAFSHDTPWQQEFEDQFPYELTDDQQVCVGQIMQDMESPINMDRLLCGDVGYGKTEVALRAAFKAVVEGKQVALLAPTTILVQQHYRTICSRFQGFSVSCDMLSRFRSPKEQKEVLQRLKEGTLDIVVGTHRLLGKDVQFKDLGLLIVDEEHRFGVQHKETIKNLKTKVDVLTLSATPIPRTLHMSMVGIRDMSLLETPPEERLPVKTYVMSYNDAVVRDAIRREMQRGGQVYFLYNRVRSIETMYARIKTLVPEARIGIAHGQMRENALEDVMLDFYAGAFDVLLCSTIVENGLDVPQANTLIVFDADRFGLSQLYQIRGRVGRSSRQAYAYFMVRKDKQLSETAEKRLAAIKEFTEFGAGYRVAMRDLEIRGAGDVLGPEQHGHLSTVGYDMYCKLVEQAVDEAQGKEITPELDTRVELAVDAYLPEKYVPDEKLRIEMYKRIAMINDDESRADIEEELVDRFGDLPQSAQNLIGISTLRAVTRQLGVSHVTLKPDGVHLRVDKDYMPDMQLLLQAVEQTDKRLKFGIRPPEIVLTQKGLTPLTAMSLTTDVLHKVHARLEALRKEQPQVDTAQGAGKE